MIKIVNLTKEYEQVVALDHVTLELEEKGFVFVNGISGSGKTTLMNLLSGLDSPTSGEIYYKGEDITKYNSNELDGYRNMQVGVVFQNFNLIDDMTVEENLLLPLMIQGVLKEKKLQLVEEVLNYVGLEGYAKRKGYELSAGQKQRIAIARAIIKRPKVIFADEATGNLDPKNTEQILRLFHDISKQCLVVLISHNNISARKYADRILTLDEGKICEDKDNRHIKELYMEPYKISVDGHGYKNKIPLDIFDIKDVINELNIKSGRKTDRYCFETEIVLEKKAKAENKTWLDIGKTTIEPMPWGEIFKCMARIIKMQRFKNILVVCLVAFISLLFFLINSLNKNDYYVALSNYINTSNSLLYPIRMSLTQEDEDMIDIYKGETVYKELEQIISSQNIVKSIGEISLYTNEQLFSVTAFEYGIYFENVDILGTWPTKTNEVAVSKDFADEQSISVGDVIEEDNIIFSVCGIYDFTGIVSRYTAVVSQSYAVRYIEAEKFINLQACNIIKSVSLNDYVSEIATIGSVENMESGQLIWGRMPNAKNEIVISSEILRENDMTLDEGFITKYRLHNLYDEKYHNAYDDFVNMYAYLGKNVEVVGVYECSDDVECIDILIDNNAYTEIIDYYTMYLNYESLYAKFNYENYKEIKAMKEKNIFICDGMCSYIYSIQDFFSNMKSVISVVIAILMFMVVFVIVSFLSYNVKDYTKTIGIYKSLGIKNIDIVKIFMMYNLQLSILAVAIANMALYMVVRFINQQMLLMVDTSGFEIFVLNHLNSVWMSAVVVFISVLATIIPLFRMVRKESVLLINREES